MALHWGILGTGRIAGIFAKGVLASQHGKITAIGSRSAEKAAAFGKDFLTDPAITRHASYEALLADPNVHAIYIATPHPQHAKWAIACMNAGKHVLVEKPLGINHAEAMVIFETARRTNRFCMEAFMYRCHPMMTKIADLIRSGAIGQVRAIHASFAFNSGPNKESRLMANALAGGGILDVGGYPVSFARFVATVAFESSNSGNSSSSSNRTSPPPATTTTTTLSEPTDIKAIGHVGPTGVDEYTMALLKFPSLPSDIIASVATGVQVGMDNTARIFGSAGSITFTRWVPSETGNTITLNANGKTEEINCDAQPPLSPNVYGMEADIAANAIAQGKLQADFPAMSWADSLNNLKVLDAWRAAIGQKYDSEKTENQISTVAGTPLIGGSSGNSGNRLYSETVTTNTTATTNTTNTTSTSYFSHPHLRLPISRLILGVDNQSIDAMPHASAMFDDYFERGGNTFDSAWIYAGGRCEKALGIWIKNRNIRSQVNILGKGAHTPACNPKDLTKQLLESLDRYQTDYIDIYMMHRDNPDVPIGEFVDVLNEHHNAGRIKIFGGSNWTAARLDAANVYAKSKNLQPFACVSNNFSLARMVDAPWAGCVSASDPAFRDWLKKNQMPLFAWSSQARGFFVRGDPAFTADADLVRCWYADDNFDRLARAKDLAAKKSVTPIQIALAYVLHQPFPTLALIGPRAIEETRTSMDALKITLTPDEVKWLNLET